MHPVRKQRLIIVVFIVLLSSVAVSLTLVAFNENLNLFYPPSKIVSGVAPVGKTIRAGGCVVPGSIVRDDKSLKVDFKVTDGMAELAVTYDKLLPDLFAEGEAAVITGQLDQNMLMHASTVLAKHDENYTPNEVADTVHVDGDYKATCDGVKYN